MKDFSLIEKLQILMKIIFSSPLFLFCFLFLIIILGLLIISRTTKLKISKWFFVGIWAILFLIIIINYSDIVIKLTDEVLNYIFKILYFPDLPIYVVILIISNILLILSIVSKNIKKSYKVLNITTSIILDIMLVLVIDIVSRNNIEIYNSINIYTNSDLLVLLEVSIAIFVSWLLLNVLITAHNKLKKFDKVEYPKMQEIIFDEI